MQRRDGLERVAEAKGALGAGRGINAGDDAYILVDDPEGPVGVRHLAGSVTGLVGRDDLSRLVDLVDGPLRLVRRPRVAAADRETGAADRLRNGGGGGDRVGLGVDSLDAVAAGDPERTVAVGEVGRVRQPTKTALHRSARRID